MDERPSPERRWSIAYGALVALSGLLAFTESSDPDLGFHIATGRLVWATGAVPATNELTFAEAGHAWINQQWLPALLFASAFDVAGFTGTLVVKIAFVCATAACLVATARALGATPESSVPTLALGAWGSAFRFVERPLLASNLALALVLLCLARARASSRSPSPRSAIAWVLVAGFVASTAVHLHAGALFSLLAMLVVAAALVLDLPLARWVGREPELGPPLAWRAVGSLVIATLLAVVLAAIVLAAYHPHGLAVLGVPLRMASDPYLSEHLVEFRPAWSQPLRIVAPALGFAAMCVVVSILSRRRATAVDLALVGMGLALSLRHARFADLSWILAGPIVAKLASGVVMPRGSGSRAAVVAAIVMVLALLDRTAIAPPGVGAAAPIWPEVLFDALRRQGLVGPVFVQDGWAGPFLARFWPRERVFFHPAFEAYSEQHYRLYQSIRYGEPGWDQALDSFGVQVVLLKHTSAREQALQSGRGNLRQRLAEREAWALVAFDEHGALWVRRDGPNASAAREAPSFVDPDRHAFQVIPAEARAGLEHLQSLGPASIRLDVLLAVARAADGDPAGAEALLAAAAERDPEDPRIALARRSLMAQPLPEDPAPHPASP